MTGFLEKLSSQTALSGAKGILAQVDKFIARNPESKQFISATSLEIFKRSLKESYKIEFSPEVIAPSFHTYDFHVLANYLKKAAKEATGPEHYSMLLVCAAFSILGATPKIQEREKVWIELLKFWTQNRSMEGQRGQEGAGPSRALCIPCGSFKSSAFERCRNCGHAPQTPIDAASHMYLTTKHFAKDKLEEISAQIKATGVRVVFPEDKIWEAAQTIAADPFIMGLLETNRRENPVASSSSKGSQAQGKSEDGTKEEESIEFEIDYHLKSNIASTLEAFVVMCGSDWEEPSEHLKDFSMRISKSRSISIEGNEVAKKGPESVVIIPFAKIQSIKKISKLVVKASKKPGPFVNPLLDAVVDEIIAYIREQLFPKNGRQ